MAFKFTVNLLLSTMVASAAFAQQNLRTSDAQQLTNARASRNYVKNSGAEANDLNVSDPDSIVSRTTSSVIAGKASFLIDADASLEVACWALDTFQDEMDGNAVGSFEYKGDASLYQAYVENVTDLVKASATQTLTNASAKTTAELLFVANPAKTYQLCVQATNNAAAAFRMDKVYVGPWDGVATIAQPEEVVVASRASSDQSIGSTDETTIIFNAEAKDVRSEFNTSTGVFTASRAGTYLISGNPILSDNDTNGFITRVKYNDTTYTACAVSTVGSASGVTCSYPLNVGDTLRVTIQSTVDTSYNVNLGSRLSITYIPPASTVIRTQAPGADWTTYTGAVVSSSGTITNATHTMQYKCVDQYTALLRARTAFSATSSAFSSIRYPLPTGMVPNRIGNDTIWGGHVKGGNNLSGVTAIAPDDRLVPLLFDQPTPSSDRGVVTTAIDQTSSGSGLTITSYSGAFAIQPGFCPSVPSPWIKQNVVTKYGGTASMNWAFVTNNGSTCTIGDQSGFLSGGTRTGTGLCEFDMSGYVRVPACQANQLAAHSTNVDGVCQVRSSTTSSKLYVTCGNNGLGAADRNFSVFCPGPIN